MACELFSISIAARFGMNRSLKHDVEEETTESEEEPSLLLLLLLADEDSCFLRSQRARTPLRMEVFASEKPLLRISSKSTTFEVILVVFCDLLNILF